MILYLPTKKQFVMFFEGSGENLTQEDIDGGYIDYIDYTYFKMNQYGEPDEIDGGEYLLSQECSSMTDAEFIKEMCKLENITSYVVIERTRKV